MWKIHSTLVVARYGFKRLLLLFCSLVFNFYELYLSSSRIQTQQFNSKFLNSWFSHGIVFSKFVVIQLWFLSNGCKNWESFQLRKIWEQVKFNRVKNSKHKMSQPYNILFTRQIMRIDNRSSLWIHHLFQVLCQLCILLAGRLAVPVFQLLPNHLVLVHQLSNC